MIAVISLFVKKKFLVKFMCFCQI